MRTLSLALLALVLLAGCGRLQDVGRAPEFTPVTESEEFTALAAPPLPMAQPDTPSGPASLWNRGRTSLLGDRRAMQQGDILTVVIEIDDKAEISNSTDRSRTGSETLGIGQLFGIPQITELPGGASLSDAIDIDSSSSSGGDGSVKRNEKLTLRIAATVTGVLPNGVLQIVGRQEIRVNFEMRELQVTGYVRPQDVSRQNEITYDKIASARISYGGRGHISDVQQPRYGHQIADILLPF